MYRGGGNPGRYPSGWVGIGRSRTVWAPSRCPRAETLPRTAGAPERDPRAGTLPLRRDAAPAPARHSAPAASWSGESHEEDPVFVPLSVLEFRDRAATYFGDKVGIVDGDRDVHLPRLGRADPPAGERAPRPGRRARRPRLVHHLQHASPARGLLRCRRGRRRAEPREHPARAPRDRLHPGARRVADRLLPRGLLAAGGAARGAPLDAPTLRDHGGRAGRSRERRVRGPDRRRLSAIRATRRSTRTRSPSSSTPAAPPACPRASP